MQDYRRYEMSPGEVLAAFAQGILLSMLLGWLFYRSILGMILLLPLSLLVLGRMGRKKKEERMALLERQFRDGLQALSTALCAGYSVENAFYEAGRELAQIYGKDAILVIEFAMVSRQIQMNRPVEAALADLAERSGLEDIRQLAEVFAIVKRNGGPLVQILKSTAQAMEEKWRTREEIHTIMASRRLEQRIMSVMPIAIIGYVNLGNAEFTAVLYEGLRGRIIMTAALGIYGLALWLGERIMDVQV